MCCDVIVSHHGAIRGVACLQHAQGVPTGVKADNYAIPVIEHAAIGTVRSPSAISLHWYPPDLVISGDGMVTAKGE